MQIAGQMQVEARAGRAASATRCLETSRELENRFPADCLDQVLAAPYIRTALSRRRVLQEPFTGRRRKDKIHPYLRGKKTDSGSGRGISAVHDRAMGRDLNAGALSAPAA
jgi:hypothetical protein